MSSPLPIKVQFFLTYGVLGSLSPIAALVLRDAKGFSPQQFGITLAFSSLGLLFSPAVTSWLADQSVDTRMILRGIFIITTIALIAVVFSNNVWTVTIAWAVYSILYVPTWPLLDGYYFKNERENGIETAGQEGSYQFVRVWGTIGYLVPSIFLYFVITNTGEIANALWVAIAWSCMCFTGTFFLESITLKSRTRIKAPTLQAARTLFSKATLPLCIGLFFVHTSASTYYPIMSLFLRDEVGIADEWVALVLSVGVLIEIGYIFGLGPIRKWLRIRGIMIVGLSAMAVRLALLAQLPTVTISLVIQLAHGMEILAVFIVPVMYLDRVAGDGFRNSIQGVFTIIVVVPTRLIGPLLAGQIRGVAGTTEVLYIAAALSGIGMLIIFFFFRPGSVSVFDTG